MGHGPHTASPSASVLHVTMGVVEHPPLLTPHPAALASRGPASVIEVSPPHPARGSVTRPEAVRSKERARRCMAGVPSEPLVATPPDLRLNRKNQ